MRLRAWLLVLAGAGSAACHSGAKPVHPSKDAAVPARDGASMTLEYPLERIEQLPSVPYGTPAGELVYDFGVGTGMSPGVVHIDRDGMYWTIVFTLYWGSPNGEKEPQEIARCGVCGDVLDSDATHIYWLDGSFLRRRSKQLDPEEEIALKWSHVGGDALVGETYLYTAMPGCGALTRIDKQTLQQEFTYSEVERGVGDTRLALADDGTLYCGAWRRIVRIREWGAAEVVYDGGTSIEGVHLTPTHLVWLDNEPDSSKQSRVGRMPVAGGDAELFPLPINGVVERSVLDQASRRLIFIHGSWVTSFDLERATFRYIARDYVRVLEVWKDDVYWTVRNLWDEARGGAWSAIRKLPADAPPVYVF